MNDKYLYAPWRLDYILSNKCEGCIFCCNKTAKDDEKNFIVYRSKHCFVMLNMYPYNNGHIMVVPQEHVPNLTGLSPATYKDVFATVRLAETILNQVYNCEGINIGINIGKAAGAGIAEHVHVHLVPRWSGDSNFMSVIGGERVIPEPFERAFKNLRNTFNKHKKLIVSKSNKAYIAK